MQNKKTDKIIKSNKNKTVFQKISWFLLEDESWISWLVCLTLCFLIIKFIFFPLMGVLFSTNLPFVIVESESMQHNGNFEQWWTNFHGWYDNNNITKEQFLQFPLHNGFDKGDIIAVRKVNEYKIGDIIVFDSGQSKPIIHRTVESNISISTKGDNNNGQLPGGVEDNIQKDKIYGKAIFKIPKLGWVKLFIVENYKKIRASMKK